MLLLKMHILHEYTIFKGILLLPACFYIIYSPVIVVEKSVVFLPDVYELIN